MGRYERFRQSTINKFKHLVGFSGGVPITQRRESEYREQHYPREPLTAAAPNMGHDTDSYNSDWALFVDYWSRALYTSLTGKLLRGDVDITGGHKHDSYLDDLEWIDFARVRSTGDNQGLLGPPEAKHGLYYNNTGAGRDLNLMCHVPTQFSGVDVLYRVSQPAPGSTGDGWLNILPEVYDLNTDPATPVKDLGGASLLSVAAGVTFPNYWVGPNHIDLRSFAIVRGFYWVRVRVRGRILSTAEATLNEVRLGKVRR